MIGRRTPGSERGYVLMIVLVLILVMSTAAVYGVRAMDSEVRASASTRKNEMAMHAAEAGASERLAEIALATDDAGAALDSAFEQQTAGNNGWVQWPPPSGSPGGFTTTTQVDNFAQFQTDSAPLVAVEARPPPGVQIGAGGQVTVWRVDSYAITGSGLAGSYGYSQQVQVGVSLWSRGGMSYNN